jgi:hypothetical protein
MTGTGIDALAADRVIVSSGALNCPIRPAASEQLNRELSQVGALAPVHHRRTNSLRHNDVMPAL